MVQDLILVIVILYSFIVKSDLININDYSGFLDILNFNIHHFYYLKFEMLFV